MIDQKPINKMRGSIIVIVIIISIVLYLAGVFSGLFANNIIKKETQQNIDILKKETESYLSELENYIEFLDTNLKSMQLEETFAETLTPEEKCDFFQISLNELVGQLGYYWDRLPYRLEEYEKNNILTDEYILLKEQYTHLSIRIWILAKKPV